MPTNVTMPQLSETMKDGKLLRWLVQPGDYVYEGDALAEIEADKANMELEALVAGTLKEVLANPGDVVAVGDTVAVLEEGESASGTGARASTAGSAAASESGLTASSLAQRMAAEKGIDIARVPGTGPGGAVTPGDIDAFVARQSGAES